MGDLQQQQQQSVKIEHHNARIQLKLSPEDREAEILRYAPSSSPDGEDQPRSPSGDSLGPETSHESEQTHSPHLTPPATDDHDHDRTTVELRLLVRRREAGALIGRRGANIKRLREQFRNSIFSIPDTGNGPERVVCVATGERSVGPILDELTQVLVEKSGECDDQLELKLLIHSSQAGSIIGLGGQSIKKLRNDSKAAIKIYELCCPFSSDRVCAIKAKPPVVVRTVKLIQSILNQNPIKGTVKPYDALHFDPLLADKYGGYLPDDGQPADTTFASSHHHHHQHHHQHPATTYRNHFEPLGPLGFGRLPPPPPEPIGYPLPPTSNHFSVWRPGEFRDHSPQCSDISCLAAAAAAANGAPRARAKSQIEPNQVDKQPTEPCDHHHHHLTLSMNQLVGAYAAAAAAARSRAPAPGTRFHPYGQFNYHLSDPRQLARFTPGLACDRSGHMGHRLVASSARPQQYAPNSHNFRTTTADRYRRQATQESLVQDPPKPAPESSVAADATGQETAESW